MMRIAEISVHGCPLRPLGSKDSGGMNVYVQQLSQELGRLGVEVDIFTRRHNSDEPEVRWLGDKVRLIHIAAGQPQDMPTIDLYHHLPQFITNLRHFIDREGTTYDLWHSHYWLSAWAAQQLKAELGIPHIVTFHTLAEVKYQALPTEIEPEPRPESERKIVAVADRIIAFTAEEKHNLIHIYGARPDKVEIAPCGVDLDLFRPMDKEKARHELGLAGQVLLFAGRFNPIKGIDILLGAIGRLTDSRRLLIVGGDLDSEEMARLHSMAGKLSIGEQVTFLGTVEHERMPLFYNAADVCVVPSYHESFGLVALESLACGTPVVARRAGGLATTIKDGETGYLIAEPSPAAFAQRLEMLLGNKALRQRMGDTARSSVAKYSWPLVARQVLRIYRELTGAQSSLVPEGFPFSPEA